MPGVSHAILSPHFDDAVLSCWRLLDGLEEVTVVNVFAASPPAGTRSPWWDRATGATDPVERMRERREEDAAALAVVGRAAVQLGLLDDQYRDAQIFADEVAERIGERVDPGVTLHAPGAFDGHPDHLLVRNAALELAGIGRQIVLYADLPHATTRGWPDWVSGDTTPVGSEVAADWDRVLVQAGLRIDELVRHVHPLNARARARKLRALAAYKTQLAGVDGYGFVPLDDPRALAWEVSWEVPASARRSADQLLGEPVVADRAREPPDDRI